MLMMTDSPFAPGGGGERGGSRLRLVSDCRAGFGRRSILMDLTEESADGGDDRSGSCAVDEVETVTDAWQLDVADGLGRHGSQLADERARFPDRDEAVAAAVHDEKRWRSLVDPI